jgi:hypothetical protein
LVCWLISVFMAGNTDFWRNDPFRQTSPPRPGNNLFGSNRCACKRKKELAIGVKKRIFLANECDATPMHAEPRSVQEGHYVINCTSSCRNTFLNDKGSSKGHTPQ